MKRIYEFYVQTMYVGSRVTEEIELEFADNATEKEITEKTEQAWINWRNDK